MKPTKRSNSKTFEASEAKRADHTGRDESGPNVVIELDQAELAQVAGGRILEPAPCGR